MVIIIIVIGIISVHTDSAKHNLHEDKIFTPNTRPVSIEFLLNFTELFSTNHGKACEQGGLVFSNE